MNGKKVALVTGASSGIGTEVALALLDRGYAVHGAARRVDRMKDIVARGGKAVPLDLADEAPIESCVGSILEREGRLEQRRLRLLRAALWGRALLPDRAFDRVIRRMLFRSP
jgi:NADP-dependent 3-hydroxy acid dehydrogenase YdfG